MLCQETWFFKKDALTKHKRTGSVSLAAAWWSLQKPDCAPGIRLPFGAPARSFILHTMERARSVDGGGSCQRRG